MLFNQLGLTAELLRAVDEKGYQEATPIQQQSIPLILEGRDVSGRRPNGHRQNGRLHVADVAKAAAVGQEPTQYSRPGPYTNA